MLDILKHLIISIVILRNTTRRTHIVVLFLMSAVKSPAEKAIGQHTV